MPRKNSLVSLPAPKLHPMICVSSKHCANGNALRKIHGLLDPRFYPPQSFPLSLPANLLLGRLRLGHACPTSLSPWCFSRNFLTYRAFSPLISLVGKYTGHGQLDSTRAWSLRRSAVIFCVYGAGRRISANRWATGVALMNGSSKKWYFSFLISSSVVTIKPHGCGQ